MTSNNDSELDWGPTREFVGRDIMLEPKTGIDAVENSAIRRQMEVLEMGLPTAFRRRYRAQAWAMTAYSRRRT